MKSGIDYFPLDVALDEKFEPGWREKLEKAYESI